MRQEIMCRSCFLRVLLLLLALLFSHGIGKKVMETVEIGKDSAIRVEETEGNSRIMMQEMLDYQLDPGPNTNPKTGYMFAPPPQGDED